MTGGLTHAANSQGERTYSRNICLYFLDGIRGMARVAVGKDVNPCHRHSCFIFRLSMCVGDGSRTEGIRGNEYRCMTLGFRIAKAGVFYSVNVGQRDGGKPELYKLLCDQAWRFSFCTIGAHLGAVIAKPCGNIL